jgi:hypothetical protein
MFKIKSNEEKEKCKNPKPYRQRNTQREAKLERNKTKQKEMNCNGQLVVIKGRALEQSTRLALILKKPRVKHPKE